MDEIKNLIGIIAIFLTFFGYVPYIKDTIKGKTHPHIYSWFLWATISAIAFALQISHGAGIGGFVTLAAALVCYVICFFGIRSGKKDITKSDTVFLILTLIALVIWLLAKQPVLSVILLSITEMLAFIPTIRKSWNKPLTETLSSYIMNTIRFTLGIIALQNYSIITSLYPVTWLLANGLFSILLIVRRKHEISN
jgi:hypothetical protein